MVRQRYIDLDHINLQFAAFSYILTNDIQKLESEIFGNGL